MAKIIKTLRPNKLLQRTYGFRFEILYELKIGAKNSEKA